MAKKKSLNKEGLGPIVFDLDNNPPRKVRKPRAKSRQSADVLRESVAEPKAAGQPQGRNFNLRIAESRLDVYRSPHLIDLSQAGKIEKTKPTPKREWPVEEMPAGKFMARTKVLDFFDLTRSEIYLYLLRVSQIVRTFFLILFSRAKLDSKLAADSHDADATARFHQVSFVNFFFFLADQVYRVYLAFYKLFWLLYIFARKIKPRDEVIYLPAPGSEPQKAAVLDTLLQAAEAPTIIDLIKSYTPAAKVRPLAPPPSGREVREKYLETNPFMRKGVVLNTQPPSAQWPKHHWLFDFSFSNFEFRGNVLRSAAVFCGIMLALFGSLKVITFIDSAGSVKGKVMGAAEQAVGDISRAGDNLKKFDLASAQTDLISANNDFKSANDQLNQLQSFITVLAEAAPNNTYKSGKNTLELGQHLSAAAVSLLSGITSISSSTDLALASRVKNFSLAVGPALTEMTAAEQNAQKISVNHLPRNSQEQFTKLKTSLPGAVKGLQQLKETLDFSAAVLGDNDLRRYLLVFQNDNELRATGGFMGSYALVDFKNGKIEKITIPQGGTYDVRDGFHELVAPPEPLRLVCSRWELQDTNWWPDWPTSAQNIKWFYEKSGGPTVDGVIAINSSWFKELLKVTGPISLPQYGKTITSANFEDELQKSIELQVTDKTKPKKILSDLAPKILDKIFNLPPQDNLRLAEAVAGALKSRDIQLYFNHPDLQKFALKNDWAGALAPLPANTDYLNVVATNIGGGKTDDQVRQQIYHQAEIAADGTVIDKVLISRYNASSPLDPLRKTANNTYLRVYVPLGSELISAQGFNNFDAVVYKPLDSGLAVSGLLTGETQSQVDEVSGTKIYTENDRTVFANWTKSGPGESRDLLLVYRLPFRVNTIKSSQGLIRSVANYFSPEIAPYSFVFQKQSGRSADQLESAVTYGNNLAPKLVYPKTATTEDGLIYSATKTGQNQYLSVAFIK